MIIVQPAIYCLDGMSMIIVQPDISCQEYKVCDRELTGNKSCHC